MKMQQLESTPVMTDPILGQKVSYSRIFTDQDLVLFAQLSGDDNPIHIDEDYARASRFGRRVVHGMLTGSMFTRIFGKHFPGPGGIYLEQQLTFIKPVFLNEAITASIELIAYDVEKRIGIFDTFCHDHEDTLLLRGTAKVLFPKKGQ